MFHLHRRAGATLSLMLVVAGVPALGWVTTAAAHATGAAGQIVFDHGNDLWAANADGSGAHVLVTAREVGVDHLGEPAVAPRGDLLLFTGWSDTDKLVSSHDITFWGLNHMRTFALHDGRVTALSAPARRTSTPRETDDLAAEPAPDGRHYVYTRLTCTEAQYTDSGAWARVCTSRLRTATLPGGAASSAPFASACDAHTLDLPGGPAVDPASPSQVAYAGCQNTPADQAEENPESELTMSGPGHQGEHAIGWTVPTRDFVDPSFSPDGTMVVADNPGGELTEWPTLTDPVVTEVPGGIYSYASSGATPDGRLVVRAPDLGTSNAFGEQYAQLAHPRYLGPDTIGFVYDGSVYTVPATCSGCTIGQATRIHDGGSSASTQAFALAWTERSIAPYRRPAPTQHLWLGRVPRQHARAVVRHGVRVAVTCRMACRAGLALTVSARGARRLHLITRHRLHVLRAHHRHTVAIGHRTVRLRAGHRTWVRVRLTRHARRVLRHRHSWTMRLSATPSPGGSSKAQHRTVRVRR